MPAFWSAFWKNMFIKESKPDPLILKGTKFYLKVPEKDHGTHPLSEKLVTLTGKLYWFELNGIQMVTVKTCDTKGKSDYKLKTIFVREEWNEGLPAGHIKLWRSYLDPVPPGPTKLVCICPQAYNCVCGAFAMEMEQQGKIWNKWTKTWERR